MLNRSAQRAFSITALKKIRIEKVWHLIPFFPFFPIAKFLGNFSPPSLKLRQTV